jgi:hypothetical protein
MLCPACKQPIPVAQRRCPQCTQQAPAARGSRPARPVVPARKSPIVPIVIIVLLAAACGGAYFFKTSSNDAAPEPVAIPRRDPLAGLPAKVRDPKAQLGEDQDSYVSVEPGAVRAYSLEADRALIAVYDVTPTDGTVFAVAMKTKSSVSMTPEQAAAVDQSAVEIRKGSTSILHCEAANLELVGLFLKNKGSKRVNVRVRRRWWGLEEQAPEPKMELHTRKEIFPPGGDIEMLISADRRSKGLLEIIPSMGTISVALIPVPNSGDVSNEKLKEEARARLSDVTAPGIHRIEYHHNPGDGSYCLIRNRGDKIAVVEIRHHTGLRR